MFLLPLGIAFDSARSTLYVSDLFCNNIIAVNTVTALVTAVAGSTVNGYGITDGMGGAALFTGPGFIAYDAPTSTLIVPVAGG